MNKNIHPSLDLSKSLANFKEKVTKLLEIKNLSEWSAQTFKNQEEEIRNTALTLAGECIAVLLNQLSGSKDALDTAITQTKSYENQKIRRYGNYQRQILTVGHVKVTLSLPYVVERNNQSHQKGKYLKLGFCPFLKWLGIEEGLTPSVWATITKYGAIAGSFEAAHTILMDWGINISLKRIERITYYFGKIGINLRQSKLSNLENGSLHTGNFLKDQRVVIAVDGGRTRIVHQLPLGSGAVESLIRQAVNLRMKGNSKFWLPDNAEIMLHLRCQWCAYSWDNFCKSIFNSLLNPSSA